MLPLTYGLIQKDVNILNYTTLYEEIRKVINKDGKKTFYFDAETALNVELWETMYQGCPYWVDGNVIKSMNLPSAISAELSKLVTFVMKTDIKGF